LWAALCDVATFVCGWADLPIQVVATADHWCGARSQLVGVPWGVVVGGWLGSLAADEDMIHPVS